MSLTPRAAPAMKTAPTAGMSTTTEAMILAVTNWVGVSGVSINCLNQPLERSAWMLAPAFMAAPSPPKAAIATIMTAAADTPPCCWSP